MPTKKQLGDLLVDAGIITTTTLQRALERQKGAGKRLGTVLEEMGVITEEELLEALAKQFNFKTAKGLANYTFPPDLLSAIPGDLALQRMVFPLKKNDLMLAVAITDPFDTETLELLGNKTGMKVFPVLATRKDITAAIAKNYLKEGGESDHRKKIIIVEDSAPVATIIEVALTKEGYNVFKAADGLEGLKTAITERPDLIICDSVMPKMDGYGLMRALKAHKETASIPMILLTSKASGEDEQKALESGFLDFIPKPVQPIRIVTRVKRAFELLESMKR